MFCPQCKSEFRPGFDHCPDCDVDLVKALPPEIHSDTEVFETVLEISEVDLVPFFKSLLEGANIPYETWGEDLLNLYPLPATGLAASQHSGAVAFLVPVDRLEEAKELLASQEEIGDDEYGTDMLNANRALWDAWTEINVDSDFYDVESFREGKTSLQSIELEELGSQVEGKSLLHLQCHFGLDTLSWARMGAQATGVDLSPKAVEVARTLAAELDLEARFIASDVLQLDDQLDETFDIVFTSYGVLTWLPDLDVWARTVANALEPGGVFYMVEFHPLLNAVDDTGQITGDYFGGRSVRAFAEKGSYADPDADFEGTSYVCDHSLGDILSAIAGAGLHIDFLHEFPYSPYDCFPFTELVEPGRAMLKNGRDRALPLVFSVQARKPE